MTQSEKKTTGRVEYFTPISDDDVPGSHQLTVTKYRRLATELDVPETTAVCYRVRAGFTLQVLAGSVELFNGDGFTFPDRGFPDVPTQDGLVFWVPRIVAGTTSRTADEQVQVLAALRTRLDLPAHHLTNFGDATLVTGLILAHHRATGERVPLNYYWVHTATCAGNTRLELGDHGEEFGLDCEYTDLDDHTDDIDAHTGVFAIGIDPLT